MKVKEVCRNDELFKGQGLAGAPPRGCQSAPARCCSAMGEGEKRNELDKKRK